MAERIKHVDLNEPWLVSPFPIKGAGAGRLGFGRPAVVEDLVASRAIEVRPGLTIAEDIANNADSLLRLQAGEVLVDLGCGPGLISYYLLPKLGETGWLYCVDASKPMLQHASGVLWGKRATLIYGDIHTVDRLIPEKADAALLSGNVHLLTNRPLAFRAIRETLRPDGRLVVVTHTYFSDEGGSTNFYASTIDSLRETRPEMQVEGLRLPILSEKELKETIATIQGSGFQVHAYESDTWSPDTNGVMGINPRITIINRLKIVQPQLTPAQLESTAELVIEGVHRGREAQIYLLCTTKDTPLKIST